ncbi:MAG: hypothetical protein K2J20_02895 [Bacilli bacterium]|nr:hypothetical protein [Bacilli bacterium]
MKTRHVIMIITLIIVGIAMICIKDAKTTLNLTCTASGSMYEMDSVSTLKVKVKNNKIKKMDLTIDVVVPENKGYQKEEMINAMNSEGKMQVVSTDEGMRLSTGMNSDYFKTFGLSTESSYSELKKVLELQGYTCK